MLGSDHREFLFSMLRDLIRTPSPSGREAACAQLVQKYMQQLGFSSISSDIYGNVTGRLKFGSGPVLLMDSHLDHAGVSDAERWRHYPFGGDLAEGKIWGRGALDNKGALAAMLMAAHLSAKSPKSLRGTLYFGGSVYNKLMEGVSSEGLVDSCRPDYVLIGEASDHYLMHGQRGRAELLIETRGRAALTAMPQWGVNAVDKMMLIVAELNRLRRTLPRHPILGEVIMEVTEIYSSPYIEVNVTPNKCRVRCDRRFPVGETKEDILARIRGVMAEMSAADPGFEADITLANKEYRCYTGVTIATDAFWPAWLLPPKHPLVLAAENGLAAAGLTPQKSTYPFSTNASYYAGVLGLPTIGFGPRPISAYHQVDESIALPDLEELCRAYYGIIRSVLAA